MHSNTTAVAAGGAGLTSPFWLTFLDPAYQVLVAALGFILLILTIRNKWLDLKIKAATLREIAANVEEIKGNLEAAPPAEMAATVQEIKEAVTDGKTPQK